MKLYKYTFVIIFFSLILSLNCTKDNYDFSLGPDNPEGLSLRDTTYSYVNSTPISSNISLPAGKLPWPHQKPDLTQSEFYLLVKNLWIINNYGLYQASEDQSVAYFHDGLDIVLDNGTKLYAVESGYVKTINDVSESGWIIIGDTPGDAPGEGWMYGHTKNFQFDVGDFVAKGSYVADIYFAGLDHVHFGRIYVTGGSWSSYSNWNYVYPDQYFLYEDTEPPVIKEPFYYFKNNSDEMFEQSYPPVISGDVDIVVGIRDGGRYAHSQDSGFGDRLCVAKIEYEISGSGMETELKKSFDFTKIKINNYGSTGRERALTVFKHYMVLHPQGITNWSKVFCYYIITNTDGTGEFNFIDPAAQDFAWNTNAKDGTGKSIYPNGRYYVTVTAYDYLGNYTVVRETVIVEN